MNQTNTSRKPAVTNCYGLPLDNVNWGEYLERTCELRDTWDGWYWYVNSNRHFFVDPDGCVTWRHGFHGHNQWMKITGKSREEVLDARMVDSDSIDYGLIKTLDPDMIVAIKNTLAQGYTPSEIEAGLINLGVNLRPSEILVITGAARFIAKQGDAVS